MADSYPYICAVVLDATDARGLAEFYRQLLGFGYRAGDEETDPDGDDWLVLTDAAGQARIAIQRVDELTPSTWPDSSVPQQLHLDFGVATKDELVAQHQRALSLGARLLLDRFDDPEEALYVYADPAGHPFCILVAGRLPATGG